MGSKSIIYLLPDNGKLEITPEALAEFEACKQTGFFSKEAGGQLFAEINGNDFKLVIATGPRPSDKRSRNGFKPDRRAEQKEIIKYYEQGLHFIGDWHTHHQMIPRPSPRDIRSMNDMAKQSKHDLKGYIMIIVGVDGFPLGLYLSFHNGHSMTVLERV